MVTKTEMLEASDLIYYRITDVLCGWVRNEGNNLEGFINNPTEHVNYNPYIIMDFGKLTQRLNMLREIEKSLVVITEYKKGNPDYTRSMYEVAIESVDVQLLERLQDWMKKRFADMIDMIADTSSSDELSPIKDYIGMYAFDQQKFLQECNMYGSSIRGTQAIIDYKLYELELARQNAIVEPVVTEQILTTNEPPSGA